MHDVVRVYGAIKLSVVSIAVNADVVLGNYIPNLPEWNYSMGKINGLRTEPWDTPQFICAQGGLV